MRSTWTDSRLDDLSARVDRQTDRIDQQSNRIDALQHTIMTVGGRLIASLLALTAAMLGTMITLLVTHL